MAVTQEGSGGITVHMSLISIHGLSKEFRRRRGRLLAVDGLDLDVPEGGVFGLLGPNGSGKTTSIRCMLGLIAPTAGTVEIFGVDAVAHPERVLPRVGALVESPKFFPTFTARRNLELLARIASLPLRRVDEVLEIVELGDRSEDQFGTFSLGMRQRLAVASTLLKEPELLVLDEPANGLDPSGIREMRELIRRLGREGRTVLVSSHQLAEVQQMCDQVAIIDRGRLLAAGPVDTVVAGGGAPTALVIVDEPERAIMLLIAAGIPARLADEPDEIIAEVAAADSATVTRVLAAGGLYLRRLEPVSRTLEDAFLAITSGVAA